MNYDNYFVLYLFIFAVVPDDDQLPQHEQDNIPPRSCTPPTPPVEADQPSPPPLPPPVRARAMGQLRPVSIPDMVSNMAGRNPIQVLADFDRHYMPHDDQPMHASARGNADEHRTALKRKAEGISFEFHGFRFESLDFYLSFTVFVSRALIFLSCLQTEATLMCMERLKMTRYHTLHDMYYLCILFLLNLLKLLFVLMALFMLLLLFNMIYIVLIT
jgi:hypothetical protein